MGGSLSAECGSKNMEFQTPFGAVFDIKNAIEIKPWHLDKNIIFRIILGFVLIKNAAGHTCGVFSLKIFVEDLCDCTIQYVDFYSPDCIISGGWHNSEHFFATRIIIL